MNATARFLIAWLLAAVAWELYAVLTGMAPTISAVLSGLLDWAVLVITAFLGVHWWLHRHD